MTRKKETIIYKIKTNADAGKGCALIDTAKNALLRIGDLAKRGDDNLKRNYGILGLAIDGIADEMLDLKFENAGYKEKLKAYEAEIAALKEKGTGNLVTAACNNIANRVGKLVTEYIDKHLNVRSKTESEATEMTKGYDLFAEAAEPTKFEAYLDDDRILSVEIVPCGIMRNSKTKPGTIRALAERARIVDYVGNEIETIYEKEAK